MARILLFVPMYNCKAQITRVLKQLNSTIVTGRIAHVLVVNNRSSDGGEEEVAKYLTINPPPVPVTLIRNDDNYGLGGSHKVAFDYALKNGYDCVAVLHGDDQGTLDELKTVLLDGSFERYDCCLGARFMKGSSLPGYSKFRVFGNRVYNLLFSCVCAEMVYDLGSGLNLYKTGMLASRFYEKFPDNLTFNYCMVLANAYYGHKAHFFPISWREDDQVSNVKLFSQALTVLGLLGKFAFGRKAFMEGDHRAVVRDQYTAEVVGEYAKAL